MNKISSIKFFVNGSHGTLWTGIHNNKKCILKSIDSKIENTDKDMIPLEIKILKQCQNIDGIVKMINYFNIDNTYFLVMEYKTSIDLFDYITNNQMCIPMETSNHIMYTIIKTILQLYNNDIFHMDIKDENIILYNHNSIYPDVKLIDFGNARISSNSNIPFYGTSVYLPPEHFDKSERRINWLEEYTVWSIGVLFFDITNGNIPFKNSDDIIKNNILWLCKINDNVKKYINKCLEKDPEKRMLLKDIKKEFEEIVFTNS